MADVPLVFLIFAIVLACAQAKQPHIVFILADDYGFNDVGYHNPRIKTPVINKLAKEGVRLENYYVQPVCTPTRSQLLSGRYQIHTGLQHGIIWPSQPNALPKNFPTIAEKLKESNYSTHMVGKWHIGFYKREFIPTQRGFDSFYGYLTGAEDYYRHTNSQGFPSPEFHGLDGYDLRQDEKVARNASGKYSTFLFAQEAERIISEHDTSQPLFLYLAFQAVHSPLQVPKQYLKQYDNIKDHGRRIYAAMTSCMDEAIGNVTKAMQKNGLWENTVLVFSTDNGGQIYYGGNNWPLRGWKASLWEGGIRGVGFVSSPLLQNPGQINKGLIHVTDWFPTLVNLGGGSTHGLDLDGFNVWETISTGKTSPRKEILHNIDPIDQYWSHPRDHYKHCRQAAIRVADWKLLHGCPGNSSWIPPPEIAATPQVSSDYHDKNSVFLFNITADPEERTDVSSQYPDVVDELMARLEMYNATAVPPRYPAPDPKSNPALYGNVWTPWME